MALKEKKKRSLWNFFLLENENPYQNIYFNKTPCLKIIGTLTFSTTGKLKGKKKKNTK